MHINKPDIFYIQSENIDPYFTMAADEYFLDQTENNNLTGILRLYNWKPASISIGYFFKTQLFDRDKLSNDKVEIVRRLTGGNAIFHNDDLTYSFILKKGIYNIEDKRQYYLFIAGILKNALLNLGIKSMVKSEISVKESSGDCFRSVSQYEIASEYGDKLIGSAQKVLKNSFLQHGSFFSNYNPGNLINYFKIPLRYDKMAGKREIEKSRIFGCFEDAFAGHFDLKKYQYSQKDLEHINRSVLEKYSTNLWNYKK